VTTSAGRTTVNTLADNPVLRALAHPCWRKTKHDSRGKAEAAMRGLLNRTERLRDGDSLCVYRCKWCAHFHVGHDRGQKGARR
jgi:hypothetical protein